jgi:hypothetical protein
MSDFWKLAIEVAGLGAIGCYVFLTLMMRLLPKVTGESLRPWQTFVLALFSVTAVLCALVAILFTYYKTRPTAAQSAGNQSSIETGGDNGVAPKTPGVAPGQRVSDEGDGPAHGVGDAQMHSRPPRSRAGIALERDDTYEPAQDTEVAEPTVIVEEREDMAHVSTSGRIETESGNRKSKLKATTQMIVLPIPQRPN